MTVIEPNFSVQQILSSSRGNPYVRGRPRLINMYIDIKITISVERGGVLLFQERTGNFLFSYLLYNKIKTKFLWILICSCTWQKQNNLTMLIYIHPCIIEWVRYHILIYVFIYLSLTIITQYKNKLDKSYINVPQKFTTFIYIIIVNL